MSQAAIPLQFEQYMQNQISIGKAPDMNEMVFAYIPDLDLDQPIDRSQGLPDSAKWVHQQDIDQVGKVGNNALTYSVVIAAEVAAFTFNAIYLRDKNVPNACGMVVHKPNETKEHGSSVTKSLLQEYVGAAQIVGIDVDAGTWQIDYQARLKGIDEDHRLACLDTYGHTAFIDGFEVTQLADVTKYKITEGIVYVGGLRGGLTGEVIQTITEKPSYIYVDLFRTGAVTSQWVNQLSIRVSSEELSDYVENSEQHYVAKLAQIDADGNVIDLRKKGGLAEHLNASDPHPQYATENEVNELISSSQFQPYNEERIYSCGEICYTKNGDTGELTYWQWYSNVESLAGKSPLLEANRQIGWTNNDKPFYWTPFKGERVVTPLWPWMSMSIPEGTLNIIGNSVPIPVFWRVAKFLPELVNAETNMIEFPDTRAEFFRVLDQGRGKNIGRTIGSFQQNAVGPVDLRVDASYSGGGNYGSHLQRGFVSGQIQAPVTGIIHSDNPETVVDNLAFILLLEI